MRMRLRRPGAAILAVAAAGAVAFGGTAVAYSAASSNSAAPGASADPANGATPSGRGGLVVRTNNGVLQGKEAGQMREFEGIPYATPPVGALRWRSPQPASAWSGVRDATKPGSRCAQVADLQYPASYAEDCLYLNVNAPKASGPFTRKPVMVWLHGGTASGAGSDYDPTPLVTGGDAIVVTVNYRLGALGFLDHPALGGAGGDYGVEDQVAALRWVSQNAAAFGGDPHNVTVFGESSGGFAVCNLLATPSARGLIDKAIIESGSCANRFPRNALSPGLGEHSILSDRTAAIQQSVSTTARLGCANKPDVLACLRAVPAKKLVEDAESSNGFTQYVYGTDVVPVNPEIVVRTGKTPQIPIMLGTTRDEMRLFISIAANSGIKYDAAEYQKLLTDTYGEHSAEVGARYPAGPGKWGPAVAWATATTDDGWSCRMQDEARELAGTGRNVFAYDFADRTSAEPTGYPTSPDFPHGAYHGSELLSLFTRPGLKPSPQTAQMSANVVKYWTNFARYGNPNGLGLPYWPQFAGHGKAQSLAPGPGGIAPIQLDDRHQCGFWDSIR